MDVAGTTLIRLELVIDSDLVSCGVDGDTGLAYFYVCGFSFNWLSGLPVQARCQTASWVLRPSVWGPTLAGETCGRFLLN